MVLGGVSPKLFEFNIKRRCIVTRRNILIF